MAERLALPTSDHGVAGSNPAGGEILSEPKRRFIAQSLSCSPFHRLEMTEILLKGRKTLTHPSILIYNSISHYDIIENLVQSLNFFKTWVGPPFTWIHCALVAQALLQQNFIKAFESCFISKKPFKF